MKLSTLNAGTLIMMQQVRLMMFSLNMVDSTSVITLLKTIEGSTRQYRSHMLY